MGSCRGHTPLRMMLPAYLLVVFTGEGFLFELNLFIVSWESGVLLWLAFLTSFFFFFLSKITSAWSVKNKLTNSGCGLLDEITKHYSLDHTINGQVASNYT